MRPLRRCLVVLVSVPSAVNYRLPLRLLVLLFWLCLLGAYSASAWVASGTGGRGAGTSLASAAGWDVSRFLLRELWARFGRRRLELDGLALERVGGVTEGRNLGVSGHTVDGADDVTFLNCRTQLSHHPGRLSSLEGRVPN